MTDSEIKAHYDEVNKLHSELTAALASRDYYKELAEAADKVIRKAVMATMNMDIPEGDLYARERYSQFNSELDSYYEHLKNKPS